MKIIIKFFVILLLFVFINILPAWAYKVGPSEFTEQYDAGSNILSLRGAGLKKFLGIQVVAVALYMPNGTLAKDVLSDCPKRLEVIYLQNIPKEELQRATVKGIRINVTKAEYLTLEPKINAIKEAYTDVRKGDKISITYIPSVGLQISVNSDDKGTVVGEDIARAFFAIWVGEHPVDPVIKGALLGGKR